MDEIKQAEVAVAAVNEYMNSRVFKITKHTTYDNFFRVTNEMYLVSEQKRFLWLTWWKHVTSSDYVPLSFSKEENAQLFIPRYVAGDPRDTTVITDVKCPIVILNQKKA